MLVAEAYYIFTDEAGAYNKRPSESFRRSHPFYIRANVRLSASDYRVFQREIQELNTKYGVPVGEEIKWSVWGDRIFEKCGIGRDERGDGGKTLEIRGKRRLSARDGGANYQQS